MFMAFKDALVICVIIAIVRTLPYLRTYPWLSIAVLCFGFSTAIEWHALATDRWGYQATMPIVPMLGTGLSPTVQLALLGLATYAVFRRV